MIRHPFLKILAEAVGQAGGRLYLVGGAVRDHFAPSVRSGVLSPSDEGEPGVFHPDVDMVALGLDLETLHQAVSPWGPARIIGRRTTLDGEKHASLLHVPLEGTLLEISPGRRLDVADAACCGPVSMRFSSQASLTEDALARDFTINAIYYDPLEQCCTDPVGGMEDLRRGRLVLCHPLAFRLDPLRLMRALAFISRYALAPSPEVLKAAGRCAPLLAAIPKERFWPEWRKWALGGSPHLGLKYAYDSGLLRCWPALAALEGTPQSPLYHPEGDAWRHTMLVVEAMARLELPVACHRVVVLLAALLHDVGKPLVTIQHEGRWISRGHAQAGLAPAEAFLDNAVCAPARVSKAVLKLVARHMDLAFQELSPRAIRRLARRLEPETHLAEFWALAASDWNGRGPAMPPFPFSLEDFLKPLAGAVRPAPPLLRGRDLLAAFPDKLQPGLKLGALLRQLEDATDDETITDRESALAYVRALLAEAE